MHFYLDWTDGKPKYSFSNLSSKLNQCILIQTAWLQVMNLICIYRRYIFPFKLRSAFLLYAAKNKTQKLLPESKTSEVKEITPQSQTGDYFVLSFYIVIWTFI